MEWEGKKELSETYARAVESVCLFLSLLSITLFLSFSLSLFLSPRSGPIPAYRLATGRKKIKGRDHTDGRLSASEPRQRKGGCLNIAARKPTEFRLTAAREPGRLATVEPVVNVPFRGGNRGGGGDRSGRSQTDPEHRRGICEDEPMIDGQPCLEIV